MKVTKEIDDDLQEWVDGAIEEVESLVTTYIEENPDADEPPDYNDLDDNGGISEIVDSAVPIYTQQITDCFYLHGDELEQAFEEAGIGQMGDDTGFPLGWKAAAIYCYIEQKVAGWLQNGAQEVFDKVRG